MSEAAGQRWYDLAPRFGTALVLIGAAVGALWMGGWWFAALVALFVGAMFWELLNMLATTPGGTPVLGALLGGAGALVLSWYVVMDGSTATSAALALVTMGVIGLVTAALAAQMRAASLVWAVLILATGLGLVTPVFLGRSEVAIYMIAIVVVTDVAGYFVGRFVGGPKFWPRFSPKKTWSGIVGGWVGAVAMTVFVILSTDYVSHNFNLWGWILQPVLFSFLSQIGDISESALKRRVGVKDSSDLLPGHGGVMDRFDGLVGAVSITMLAFLVMLLFNPA